MNPMSSGVRPTSKEKPPPWRQRQLLVVTGKGGVGKTAVAAALGGALAAAGRATLVVEVDPRESLNGFFEIPPSGGEPLRVRDRLWAQNLRPRQALDALVREKVRLGPWTENVLASPLYEQFADSAPGLKELAILGHALRIVRGEIAQIPEIETVVLDAPATGHGVALLEAPWLVSSVVDRGPLGRLGRELAGWIGDRHRCGVVAVTHAEELPVQEALELVERLGAPGVPAVEWVVLNGLLPSDEAAVPAAPLRRAWRQALATQGQEVERLRAGLAGRQDLAICCLPLVASDRGSEICDALRAGLAGPVRAALGKGPPR
jgi:anion-transporting  ArsA/GET3 family ATPase